jgi:outer membrane murein-binding lipoprotein Lpp
MAGADGRQRDLVCIPLDMLPGWLFGITTSRVRPELQPKLSRYRAECFRVLWNAFKQDILPASQPASVTVPTDRSSAAIAYEIATAVQHLARQQMELEQEQQQLAGRMQGMAQWGKQTDDRLASLELSLSEGNFIPAAKATELSERVKALATLMTERGTKDNHYQGVFAELYRRFGVSSYKTLTNEQYAAVMTFLEQWREAVLSGRSDPPAVRS